MDIDDTGVKPVKKKARAGRRAEPEDLPLEQALQRFNRLRHRCVMLGVLAAKVRDLFGMNDCGGPRLQLRSPLGGTELVDEEVVLELEMELIRAANDARAQAVKILNARVEMVPVQKPSTVTGATAVASDITLPPVLNEETLRALRKDLADTPKGLRPTKLKDEAAGQQS